MVIKHFVESQEEMMSVRDVFYTCKPSYMTHDTVTITGLAGGAVIFLVICNFPHRAKTMLTRTTLVMKKNPSLQLRLW